MFKGEGTYLVTTTSVRVLGCLWTIAKFFQFLKTKFLSCCFSPEGTEGEEEQNAEGREDDETSRGVDAGGQGRLLRSTR